MVTNHLRTPYDVYFTKKSYDSTTPVRRPAGSRNNCTSFLDIVRYPVKFRYYLKFHGACTAFGRVIKGKMTSAGHRTVPGRRPAGVCTHRTGIGRWFHRRPYDMWPRKRKLLKHRPVLGRLSNKPGICTLLESYDVSFICDQSISHIHQ